MNTLPPKYQCLSIRGSGAFGYVMEAYDTINDIRVAIKRTIKKGETLSKEYEVLSKLKDCDQVIRLFDTFYTVNLEGEIIQNLVFEYSQKDLGKIINEHFLFQGKFPVKTIKDIMRQIFLGLNFIHKKNIIHRDLKPENILLDDLGKIKICDFGSAKIINDSSEFNSFVVTRYYRAPEVSLIGREYDTKIDIFAAGCIFGELFRLVPIFKGEREGMQILELMSILGKPSDEFIDSFTSLPEDLRKHLKEYKFKKVDLRDLIDPLKYYEENEIKEAVDLISKLLAIDPKERINSEEALKHPFFKE